MHKMKGFSLVELSIVLVIIGLIVGGILVGQDMIRAAKARSTLSQLEKYTSAVRVFEEKFQELPGDMANAVEFLDASALDGDSNGYITERAGDPVSLPSFLDDSILGFLGGSGNNELAGVFHHLSHANLIDDSFDGTTSNVLPGINIPIAKTGSGGMILFSGYNSNNLFWHVGVAANTTNAQLLNVAAFTPAQAFSIDSKIDDGFYNSGTVEAREIPVALFQAEYDYADPMSPNNNCTLSGDLYDLSSDDIACSLTIRAD